MQLFIILAVVSSSSSVFGDTYPPAQFDWSKINLDEWWGPEEGRQIQDTRIRPASIVFDDLIIQDLRFRLKYHREFRPPLRDVAFNYGFNSEAINFWLSYWADVYPFKEREQFLNQYPQFKTNIQGLNIHFIWIRQQVPGKEVVPLLLMHGWPGSLREFYEAIPMLTRVDLNRDFVLEIVVPCLPGFGFSDPAVKAGMGAAEVAVVLRNLMHRLGYQKFYIQGGDWGSIIGSNMATIFSEEVLGYHTNWAMVPTITAVAIQAIGMLDPSLVVAPSEQDRMYPLTKIFGELLLETGYLHLLATKPDTIGIALTDSPAGFLAFFLEKFSTGVNPANRNLTDGGLHNTFAPEQLIDNLMFYWATGTTTTAFRLYAETLNRRELGLGVANIPTPVPTWAVQAKYEITYQSPAILKLKFPNLLNATVLEYGGHFFALEHPQAFSGCLLRAIEAFREWHRNNQIAPTNNGNVVNSFPEKVAEIANRLRHGCPFLVNFFVV